MRGTASTESADEVGTAGVESAVSVGTTSGVNVAVGVADAIASVDTVAVDVGAGVDIVTAGSGESVGVSSSDTVVVGLVVVEGEGVGEGSDERGVLVDVGATVSVGSPTVGDGGASVAGSGTSVGAGGSSVVGSGTGVRVGTVCRCSFCAGPAQVTGNTLNAIKPAKVKPAHHDRYRCLTSIPFLQHTVSRFKYTTHQWIPYMSNHTLFKGKMQPCFIPYRKIEHKFYSFPTKHVIIGSWIEKDRINHLSLSEMSDRYLRIKYGKR